MNMIYIWIALMVFLMIAEAATMRLTTIWFTIGSVFALLAAMLDMSLLVQIAVWVGVSFPLFFFVKPIVRKRMLINPKKAGKDEMIRTQGIAMTDITKHEPGEVDIAGQIWMAFCEDDAKIVEDAAVEVIRTQGATLIVKQLGDDGASHPL